MKFGVQELCDRYGIKSRKSLYSRLDGLSIALAKDGNKSYATDEQVKLLDQQDEHLKNGGTLKNFIPTTYPKVYHNGITDPLGHAEVKLHNISEGVPRDTASRRGASPLGHISFRTNRNLDPTSVVETTQHSTQSILLEDIVKAVSIAIASVMIPPDPLWYLERLETARAKGWELTTSQVKELIGVKPSSGQGKKTFRRGSFIFVKTGKIGNQTSWEVQKINDR